MQQNVVNLVSEMQKKKRSQLNRATVERKCLLKEMRRTGATLSQLAAIFGHSVIKENAANLEKREYNTEKKTVSGRN